MDEKLVSRIHYDHHVTGLSYRTLASKYGLSRSRIYRMVMSKQKSQGKSSAPREEKPVEIKPEVAGDLTLPDDVKTLKEELRKARLKIELQDLMIDISSKELGIDLRKKHGTRRSK